MRPGWDSYFLSGAAWVATRADCRRSLVGAVIVKDHRIVATGYNGAPAGMPGCLDGHCPRGLLPAAASGGDYDAGMGRCISVHAEANAIVHANRADTLGSTIYITKPPCPTCTKLIAAAGIDRTVVLD